MHKRKYVKPDGVKKKMKKADLKNVKKEVEKGREWEKALNGGKGHYQVRNGFERWEMWWMKNGESIR